MSTLRVIAQPILIAIALAVAARSAVRIYSIPSASMEPTLHPGDHILVTPYRRSLPNRGDVVVFRSPANGNELFVKRIVAVPGDLVESRCGRLFVGGHAAAEPHVRGPEMTGSILPQVVPSGSYFVLGDNRSNSFDSRHWGFLSGASLVGRARLILWSSDSRSIEPRANASPLTKIALRSSPFHLQRMFKPIE
jgi:signal peptidase I